MSNKMFILLARNGTYVNVLLSTENNDDLMTTRVENMDLLTHEQSLHLRRILMYGVTPAISILGVVGNIFSIIILLKHGLHKCSNILLICLAVTDLTFLIAFNSVPKILYEVVGFEEVFDYDRDIAFALYILYNVFNILDYAMGYISLTMPVLITIERLIAVFLPFKFHLIVTPVRTWSAVAVVYIFWYTIVIYTTSFWFTFAYSYNSEYNISVGVIQRSQFYHDTLYSVEPISEMNSYMSMKLPPAFTFVGCVLISLKVKMASIQRKLMTQTNAREASSNRTTKMLLTVCVVYMLTCFILSLPTYFPQYMHYTLISDTSSNFSKVMYQVTNIAVCINSSANFVVYVVMNKNFRDTYRSMLGCVHRH